MLKLKLNLKLEKILKIHFLSSSSYRFWRLAVLEVSPARNREMRKKLKILAFYLREWAVTQGGGARPPRLKAKPMAGRPALKSRYATPEYWNKL